jgi:hypothetical protein
MKNLLLLLLFYSIKLPAQTITIDELEYGVIANFSHLDSVLSSKGFIYLETDTNKDFKTINWSYNLSNGQKANVFFAKTVYNNSEITPLVLVQLASQSDFNLLKNSIHSKGYLNTNNYTDSSGSLNFEYKSKNFKITFSKLKIKKGEEYSPSIVSIIFSEGKEKRLKAIRSKSPNLINISKLIGLDLDSFRKRTNKLTLIEDTAITSGIIRFKDKYVIFDFSVFENVIKEVKISTEYAPMLKVFSFDIDEYGFDILSKKDEKSGQFEEVYKDFYNHKIINRISNEDYENNYIKITQF